MAEAKEQTIYLGGVHIRRAANHRYYVTFRRGARNGEKAQPVNVTTALCLDKSRQLMSWQSRVIAYVVAKRTKTLASMLPAEGQKFSLKPGALSRLHASLKDVENACFSAADEVRDQAGDVGQEVHDYIDQFCAAKLARANRAPSARHLSPASREAVASFAQWWLDNDVRPVEHSRMIYSIDHNFAGELDLLAFVRDELAVLDIKTGPNLYDGVLLQTAAYAGARMEEGGNDVDWRLTERYGLLFRRAEKDPATKYMTGEFEARRLTTDLAEDYEIFLGLLRAYRWQRDARKALNER